MITKCDKIKKLDLKEAPRLKKVAPCSLTDKKPYHKRFISNSKKKTWTNNINLRRRCAYDMNLKVTLSKIKRAGNILSNDRFKNRSVINDNRNLKLDSYTNITLPPMKVNVINPFRAEISSLINQKTASELPRHDKS